MINFQVRCGGADCGGGNVDTGGEGVDLYRAVAAGYVDTCYGVNGDVGCGSCEAVAVITDCRGYNSYLINPSGKIVAVNPSADLIASTIG